MSQMVLAKRAEQAQFGVRLTAQGKAPRNKVLSAPMLPLQPILTGSLRRPSQGGTPELLDAPSVLLESLPVKGDIKQALDSAFMLERSQIKGTGKETSQ